MINERLVTCDFNCSNGNGDCTHSGFVEISNLNFVGASKQRQIRVVRIVPTETMLAYLDKKLDLFNHNKLCCIAWSGRAVGSNY